MPENAHSKPLRAVIYARYSSDLQSEASIKDQIEVCRRYSDQRGWTITKTYEDRAISGASTARPGFQAMVDDARKQDFDIVLSENIDRLSRRVADIASLQDELSFHNIVLHTISSGEITPLLAGILGSISQQFLQDLRDKTRRDLLGRVLDGKSGGGIAYGYRVREGSTGERDIVDDEARIVRRIFEDYANGMSPQPIAKKYNREGIPGPEGRDWRDTTIRGQTNRGTGLLNNDLYIGRLVWNR